MTERLYYTEPYRTEFDAVVQAVHHDHGRVIAFLDKTAFYPTSGGQPFDTGLLADRRVADVIDGADGTVGHVVDGVLPVGSAVHGVIDWERRFDHMQQHTGQHILSAAFDRLQRARTVSFHLGTTSATIDLDREPSTEAMAHVEHEANRIVWEDRPVAIKFVPAEAAASLPLRKDPSRTGMLRLIDIGEYDLSACGGTHVARTGAVGAINVLSTERVRGGMRVEFVCGGRALASFRGFRDVVATTIRALSIAPEELPGAIARAQVENKDLRRTVRGLQERLAGFEAESLAERGSAIGGHTVVCEALDGWDAAGLKALAIAVATRPGHVVVLFSAAAPSVVAIARANDVPIDAGAVLKSLTGRFGGRGGGKADLAQGGGLTAAIPDILAAAREAVRAGLEPRIPSP